jgi:hypothetical protein
VRVVRVVRVVELVVLPCVGVGADADAGVGVGVECGVSDGYDVSGDAGDVGVCVPVGVGADGVDGEEVDDEQDAMDAGDPQSLEAVAVPDLEVGLVVEVVVVGSVVAADDDVCVVAVAG